MDVDASEQVQDEQMAYFERIMAEFGGGDSCDDEDSEDSFNPEENGAGEVEEEGQEGDEFDYDSDESVVSTELPFPIPHFPSLSEEAKSDLAWRSDDAKAFSDWTIEVEVEGTKTWKEYHVHRVTLAQGCRKCDYFKALFNSEQFLESNDRKCHIELPSDAAATASTPHGPEGGSKNGSPLQGVPEAIGDGRVGRAGRFAWLEHSTSRGGRGTDGSMSRPCA